MLCRRRRWASTVRERWAVGRGEERRLDHLTVRKGGSGGMPTILSYCQHMLGVDNYISRTHAKNILNCETHIRASGSF